LRRFDDDYAIPQAGDLGDGLGRLILVWRPPNHPGNAQLHRPEADRRDKGAPVSLAPSVGHATKRSHDDNVSSGDNLGARVDITQDDHVPVVPDRLTGTEGSCDDESGLRALQQGGSRQAARAEIHPFDVSGYLAERVFPHLHGTKPHLRFSEDLPDCLLLVRCQATTVNANGRLGALEKPSGSGEFATKELAELGDVHLRGKEELKSGLVCAANDNLLLHVLLHSSTGGWLLLLE
jgi:hypothetical protein